MLQKIDLLEKVVVKSHLNKKAGALPVLVQYVLQYGEVVVLLLAHNLIVMKLGYQKK